ncbi:MAG: phenylacetate--CoA ligase family protein, partial [Lachnospira sp.]|nr:phenylacetate--CoA ligase family protein [Lachnospira sp.]
VSCDYECGMHYWDDYVYIEIVDPKTGEPVPDGETGEIVITTLQKEGAPLIRYRTHDLSRKIPGECKCGCKYPRIDTIIGRTDDMIKVKGVNIFPSQVDELLKDIEGASSEFQIMIDHMFGKDIMTVFVEAQPGVNKFLLTDEIKDAFKSKIGMTPEVKPVEIGDLPRSEKKSTRVFDNRY